MIGTIQAARLLKICVERVRQLIYEDRIIGAKKVGRFWQIPLFNGMPKIKIGKRGPKPTWRKRLSSSPTLIHVNSHKIKRNHNNGTNEPVILVRSGSRKIEAHSVTIDGSCEVVYHPDSPLSCGAKVWIEVDPNVVVKPSVFADLR